MPYVHVPIISTCMSLHLREAVHPLCGAMFLEKDGQLFHAIKMQDRYDTGNSSESPFDDMATYRQHRSVHSSALLQGKLFEALKSRDGVIELNHMKETADGLMLCMIARFLHADGVVVYSTAVTFESLPEIAYCSREL